MSTPQTGIFALGTGSTAYLEFDALRPEGRPDLLHAIAALREPRTTTGGVNLVVGFRPELWRSVVPDRAPAELVGFNSDLVGPDGYRMPATQHDAVLWLSGSAYDIVFDVARDAIAELAAVGSVADETSSWSYRHDRDLTGFVDGSENPTLIEAAELALIAEGKPGAGGCVLLLQKWSHDVAAWESLSTGEQEGVIGRTKDESIELDDKPADSHVARTDQERFGHIFRRNTPYGSVTDHGTMFVGLSADTAASGCDAREHARPDRRSPRCAHALHAPTHRRVLLRAVDAGPRTRYGCLMEPDRARELLRAERERIERTLARLTREDDGEPADEYDPANLAADLYQDELDATFADDLRRQLEAVERAEARLAAGTYGLSVESGQLIPDGRLEALPTAELTADEERARTNL